MAANQFYSFALAPIAGYLLTNAEYLALAERGTGYAPGKLPKEDLNTPMRQACFVIAALSQFIADSQPNAVNDDGNTAAYNGALQLALRNEGAADGYLVDAGAANAYVVAFSPAQAALVPGQRVTFKAVNACTGPSTLNAGPGVVTLRRNDGGALQNGDIPAGSLVTAFYDQPSGQWRLDGIVISQLGVLGGASYITSNVTLQVGRYGINSTSGPFTADLPLNPTDGDQITFEDLANNLGLDNVTLGRNGQTIMGLAEDCDLNISNSQFSIWFSAALNTWRFV